MSVINLIIGGLLLVALVTDLKERKIYNKHLMIGLLLGIVVLVSNSNYEGMISGLKGMFIAFLLLSIPFLMNGIGGGDVKFLMVMGFFIGPWPIVNVIINTYLVGGIIALIILLYKNKLFESLKRMGHLIFASLFHRKILELDSCEENLTMPYMIPISIGSLLYIFRIMEFI